MGILSKTETSSRIIFRAATLIPSRLTALWRRLQCRVAREHDIVDTETILNNGFLVNYMRISMPAPSDLNAHLGYWLRFVSNHVSSTFAAQLAKKDVSVAEWVLMRLLYDADTMAPSVLAERIGMTRGAITKLADRLLARKLIIRTANPDDGRAQTLSLTTAGRRLVPVLAALADQNDATFFADLSATERTSLERILKKIIDKRGLGTVPID